jgi:AraC-like DNA-binding protein
MATSLLPAAASVRTRVLRGGSEAAPWELWRRAPPPELRGLVLELWAGLVSCVGSRHRVLPNGEVTIMLHIGSLQRLTEHDGASCDAPLRRGFVAGLQERPATYVSFETIRVVSARLTPIGAFALFEGLPQAELARRVFEVDAVLPARAGLELLCERMSEAPDLGVALELFELWLLRRFRAAPEPHAATLTANALLRAREPALPIGALARECGVSARRLHELFVRQVGLPAKRLSRIVRFRRALDQLAGAPGADLRALALDAGYYDQAHWYRDFRELAGLTPLEYRDAVRDALDGADVIAG